VRPLRLGTRGSKLALAQAANVSQQLRATTPGLEVDIVLIKTSGDHGLREVLGAFVKEIQEATLRGEIDAGLHCLKDLPVEEVPGLELTACLSREDSRDALISLQGSLFCLPEGAVVGTGSLRRTAQLAALRPDLRFRPIVGNIDTRLGKLLAGEYDAIVLAIAGIKRLGLDEDWKTGPYGHLHLTPFEAPEVLPAAGQAVLVLETRVADSAIRRATAPLNHEATALEAKAERAFLKGFGGGCSLPVAARAIVDAGALRLQGLVASPDGATILRGEEAGRKEEGLAIASRLVDRLTSKGARTLLEGIGVGSARVAT
jgi:hydroxymethylbilane synthase